MARLQMAEPRLSQGARASAARAALPCRGGDRNARPAILEQGRQVGGLCDAALDLEAPLLHEAPERLRHLRERLEGAASPDRAAPLPVQPDERQPDQDAAGRDAVQDPARE